MWTLELIIVGCLHVVLYGQFNYLHDMDWWAVWTKKPSPEAIENEKEKQVQVHLSRFSVIRHTGANSWIDSEQKSWILKLVYVSSSAGNPWCHWKIGLTIKSYYQTLVFWWKLDQKSFII